MTLAQTASAVVTLQEQVIVLQQAVTTLQTIVAQIQTQLNDIGQLNIMKVE